MNLPSSAAGCTDVGLLIGEAKALKALADGAISTSSVRDLLDLGVWLIHARSDDVTRP